MSHRKKSGNPMSIKSQLMIHKASNEPLSLHPTLLSNPKEPSSKLNQDGSLSCNSAFGSRTASFHSIKVTLEPLEDPFEAHFFLSRKKVESRRVRTPARKLFISQLFSSEELCVRATIPREK